LFSLCHLFGGGFILNHLIGGFGFKNHPLQKPGKELFRYHLFVKEEYEETSTDHGI
jgi:hypothetical protein